MELERDVSHNNSATLSEINSTPPSSRLTSSSSCEFVFELKLIPNYVCNLFTIITFFIHKNQYLVFNHTIMIDN